MPLIPYFGEYFLSSFLEIVQPPPQLCTLVGCVEKDLDCRTLCLSDDHDPSYLICTLIHHSAYFATNHAAICRGTSKKIARASRP